MKLRFLTLIAVLSVGFGSLLQAQTETDTYFPYPTVPESKTTLSERCNYLVEHFWERCNLKQSFSSLDKLSKSFSDWTNFMPYATSDTVFLSINNFLKDVQKLGPNYVLQVGNIAQENLFTPNSEIYSEELYLPFAKAVAENKKIDKKERAPYERQARVIENSGLGKRLPNLSITKLDGSQLNFDDVIASRVVLFFVEPDCFDCTLAKARLSADYDLNQLVNMGLIKIVALYPGANDEKWKAEAASYPENWIVGACEEVNDYFELGPKPDIYYIDARHKVLGKDVTVDALMLGLRQINQQMQQ